MGPRRSRYFWEEFALLVDHPRCRVEDLRLAHTQAGARIANGLPHLFVLLDPALVDRLLVSEVRGGGVNRRVCERGSWAGRMGWGRSGRERWGGFAAQSVVPTLQS